MTNTTVKFERRIQYVFLTILTGAILLGAISIYSFSKISYTMNKVVMDHTRNVLALHNLNLTLEKKVAQSRAYLLTMRPLYWQGTESEHDNFRSAILETKGYELDKSTRDKLQEIRDKEEIHQQAWRSVVTTINSDKSVSARDIWQDQIAPISRELDRLFAEALNIEKTRLDAVINKSHAEEKEMFLIVIGSVLTAIFFGMGLFWLIHRTVNEVGYLFQERDRNEQSLKKALKDASDFKHSLDQASIFATTDAHGVITYVNEMFCKISQYNRQELIGKTHRVVNSGYHPSEFFKDLWGTITAGHIWRGEIKNKAKDGSYYWVDTVIIPFLDSNGRPYQYTAIRNDITSKKKGEEEIRLAQMQLQDIIDNATSIIYLKDLKGNFLFVNKHFELLFGVKRDEIVGKNIHAVLSPKDAAALCVNDNKILNRVQTEQADERFFYQGKVRTFLHLCFPLKDSADSVYAIGGMLTDITERQEFEDALKSALQSRDEFISVASHELKTPLSSLKLQAQMVKRNISKGETSFFSPEKVSQIADQTDKHVGRLVRLVDDMLDMARIRSGKLSVNKEWVNLGDVILETIERVKPQLIEQDIQLETDLEGGITGFWDKVRIEQVITNLLTNAIKYGEKRPIEIELKKTSYNEACITIKDRGIGISKENQDRIFGRFERAISSNEVSGLGLGLFISKELIRAHLGNIMVDSEVGKGSTFKVLLPILDEMPNTPELNTHHPSL